MKKILIVNNNMDMGGIQKSLVNLLTELQDKYEITLLLFSKSGALLADVPDSIPILTPGKAYQILGLSRQELKKHPWLFGLKAFLMLVTKLFSRRSAMKLLGLFQKPISGFDTVISFSHLPHHHTFSNGCGDFVLDKTRGGEKICFLHCDYLQSGYLSEHNNREYDEFQKLACCSQSVKERFLQGSGLSEEKVFAVRNFYDLRFTKRSAKQETAWDNQLIHVVSVARLSKEKGITRALEALHSSKREDIHYHIIGNGPQKKEIEQRIRELGLEKQVFLLGEQKEPYGYLRAADYLLVPSYHEAAPMVFDEAKLLGVPVLTTNTTSAKEMVGTEEGIVCDNSTEGIRQALLQIQKKTTREQKALDNSSQIKQLSQLLGE